uniref:non-specific serine/threonine protein kinase n=1 Tax=Strigamia maritima TaxID=126957 RepID=T1JNR3_STRMM
MIYYHSKEIMHRDLKTSKIGEFGLAKKDKKNQSFCLQTSNIGTMPYAAPEQVDGSNYSYKVDMYSLGIIVSELFYPFTTNMEKSEVLYQIKNDNVPKSFLERWPMQGIPTKAQVTHLARSGYDINLLFLTSSPSKEANAVIADAISPSTAQGLIRPGLSCFSGYRVFSNACMSIL